MRKYHSGNVKNTMGKMKNAFPFLVEDKKVGTNNKKYLYDFSLLDKNIPENIIEKIIKQAIDQSNILNCFSIADAIDSENGKKYYVYMDFEATKVTKNNGKPAYCIMNLKAIRVAIHNINIYGYAEQQQSGYEEIGRFNESVINYVDDIEIA